MNVVCLHNARYAETQMLDSARIGLRYLQPLCDRVLLTPVDVPLFSVETAQRLMCCGAPLAAPVHGQRKGHPIMLHCEVIPFIDAYDGPGGLAGAFQAYGATIQLVEVDDSAILYDADTPEDYQKLVDLAERKRIFKHTPEK